MHSYMSPLCNQCKYWMKSLCLSWSQLKFKSHFWAKPPLAKPVSHDLFSLPRPPRTIFYDSLASLRSVWHQFGESLPASEFLRAVQGRSCQNLIFNLAKGCHICLAQESRKCLILAKEGALESWKSPLAHHKGFEVEKWAIWIGLGKVWI